MIFRTFHFLLKARNLFLSSVQLARPRSLLSSSVGCLWFDLLIGNCSSTCNNQSEQTEHKQTHTAPVLVALLQPMYRYVLLSLANKPAQTHTSGFSFTFFSSSSVDLFDYLGSAIVISRVKRCQDGVRRRPTTLSFILGQIWDFVVQQLQYKDENRGKY